jgi:hypothetical protein
MRTIRRIPRKYHLSPKERFVSVLRGEKLPEYKAIPLFRRREFVYPMLMVFVLMLLAFVVKNVLPVQNQSTSPALTQPAAVQPTTAQPTAGQTGYDQPTAKPNPGGDETMSYEEAKGIFGGNR